MSRALKIALVVGTALVLTSCDDWGDWGDSGRYKQDFAYNYTLKPGGRLSIENQNGSIEVAGWDQDKVDITGTKYAAQESAMQNIRIDVVRTDDSVRIRTVVPSGYRGGLGAKYVIRVPRKTEIERIISSNGRIQIEDIDSAARLKTSNGSVRVTRTHGNLEVETSNGGVELSAHNGPAVVHTSNGAIRADEVRGAFEARTSNGSINATLKDPEPGRPVKLESSNGSITIAMDTLRGDVRASTSNSSITLKVPPGINAQLKARTSNSSIHTDLDVNVKGTISKNAIDGTIGSGGPVIDLTTSNGNIRVQRL